MDYFVVPVEYLKSTINKEEEIIETMDAIACPKFKEALEKIAFKSGLNYLDTRRTVIKTYIEKPKDKPFMNGVVGISNLCLFLYNHPSFTKQLFQEYYQLPIKQG